MGLLVTSPGWRMAMGKLPLGRTGHMSSVVAFGAAGIGRVDQETPTKRTSPPSTYGVNHVDVGPGSGEALGCRRFPPGAS
jgi:hypothetical protein